MGKKSKQANNTIIPNDPLLTALPFSNLTNVELYDLLDSVESHIKANLENQNFSNHIMRAIPHSSLQPTPCKYYTTEDFQNKFKDNKQDMKIMALNIRSLDKHFNELSCLLSALGNMDIVAISEIGRKNIESRSAFLQNMGFNLIYDEPTKSRGGVGLLFNIKIKVSQRNDLKINKIKIQGNTLDIENIWCEAQLPNNRNIVLGVVYKHPGCSVDCLNSFKEEFGKRLEKINNEQKECIIAGDLNIDGLKINKNENVKEFFNTILDQDFMPMITLPTRVTDHSATLIDHIIVNTELLKKQGEITSGIIFSDISDHLPNFIVIKNQSPSQKKERPLIRIFGHKNTKKFQEKIKSADWTEFYKTTDPEKALIISYSNYNKSYNASFPMKRLSRKRAKDKMWITMGLKKSIHRKNRLYKQSLLKPTANNKKQYTRYKNILTSCLRQAEEQYYKELLADEKQNLKTMWNIFGKVINPTKVKKENLIRQLKDNNRTITGNYEIANFLNSYFSSVGENLAKNIKNGSNFAKFLGNCNQCNFFLKPTETNEVYKELMKLKAKKSCGDDKIQPKIVKENAMEFSPLFTHIINLSFESGTVPSKLKLAKVIPIFKKNAREDPGNYRPISLLSSINKIMEKIMHKQLSKFLKRYQILYDYQFGFREGHSTTLALIEIVDNILYGMDHGKHVAGIYMDLSKAFDTVDHEILFQKLQHYGIRGLPLQWFKSYLTNRKQYTIANNATSEESTITYGVPQGSVLGPLLFLIYTNDITNAISGNHKIRLFADDTNIFVTCDSPMVLKQEITTAIREVFQWFNANKLSANLTKTSYTVFKNATNTPAYLNSIKIEDTTIKKVPSAKYLGIILDEKLDWKEHIEAVTASLAKITNSLKIVKNFVPHKNKHLLYYAYIYSKIKYGIEVYGTANATQIKKVQVKQNRALKVLFNKDFLTPTDPLHKELEVLKVKDINKLHTAKFVHMQQNSKTPNIFKNFFIANQTVHQHNTRQNNNLHITQPNTNNGKRTMKYHGATIWNALAGPLRKIESNKTFGSQLKRSLLANY